MPPYTVTIATNLEEAEENVPTRSLRGSLLERNSGSYTATPPLMLLHKFCSKPVEFLGIALLSNPLATEKNRFYVFLFQHFVCYPHEQFHVVRARISICAHPTTTTTRPTSLSSTNRVLEQAVFI
nr:hypothetical protein Iba_scaffold1655055CG0010 [Ipomoea batatas]